MSTKSDTSPVMLQFGKLINYVDWRDDRIVKDGIAFGKQANILKNYVKYVPRKIIDSDWRPADVEAEEGEEQAAPYTAGALLEFRKDAEKRRNKAISKLEENASKFYSALWQSMSLESREQIKQHPKFEEADLEQDPNILVVIARDTHLTDIHGAGDALRDVQREIVKIEFNAFNQKSNMSITEFKHQFDSKLLILEGMGIDRQPESELAMTFLMRLDALRYADMMKDLSNMALRGIPFPKTLQAAFNAASS